MFRPDEVWPFDAETCKDFTHMELNKQPQRGCVAERRWTLARHNVPAFPFANQTSRRDDGIQRPFRTHEFGGRHQTLRIWLISGTAFATHAERRRRGILVEPQPKQIPSSVRSDGGDGAFCKVRWDEAETVL